ncbi:hypothetical protein JT55_11075 [Rhodovulum sp. NI22]|nr:hypothetical protein JT55_11075 [Rhodovulum sp. NI22]
MACPDGSGSTARLVGFDTPETYRPECPAERRLGLQATAYLTRRLDSAAQVAVTSGGGRDKYGRMLLRLYVDGRDIGQDMMAQGLAVPYDGGKRINWCERLMG